MPTMSQQLTLPDGRLLIGDEWITSATGGVLAHRFPGTGEEQAQVALAGVQEIDAAVAAAKAAAPAWRSMAAPRRVELLNRLGDIFVEHADELAAMTTLEMGATTSMAKWGPNFPASWFRYYAGWPDKIEGTTMSTYPVDGFGYSVPEP